MISSIIQPLFFIKVQPNMNEQEKKQRVYDLLNVKTKPKCLYLSYIKKRKKITEKEIFKEKGE